MTDQEDPHGIISWLNKTGYPLEMRVGAALRNKTQLFCDHGVTFVDPIKGVVRATDVVAGNGIDTAAVKRGEEVELWVRFVIECKSKPAPWIVFIDERDHLDRDFRYTVSHLLPNTLSKDTDYFEIVNPEQEIYDDAPLMDLLKAPGYDICEKRTSDSSQIDPAYTAALQAASAAVAMNQGRPRTEGSIPGISFPIVITSGLLYEAWLSRDGEIQASQVLHSKICVRLAADYGQTLVYIVSESYLDQFAKDCGRTAAALVHPAL